MADEKTEAIQAARGVFERAASAPRRVQEVDVPGFGKVHVRALRSDEFDEYEAACVKKDDGGELTTRTNRALLIRKTACTPDGDLIFRDDHLEMLRGLETWITNPIAAAAMGLCGGNAEKN